MPQSVPAGLTREHVLKTLSDLDVGIDHPFGTPTGYELVYNEKRYAPKAVVGLACRYSIGRILQPDEFSGGEAPGQANGVLRSLGFEVLPISKGSVRYWWVNQNQTYNAEISGGYLWSPKRNKNSARNQFYENMREVAPGDLIFSFRNTLISAVGVASSYGYDAPKPVEFGSGGANWDVSGWKVDVSYSLLQKPIRPKDHIAAIRPLLPPKYSPLQQDGDGLQSVYLAELPAQLAELLQSLIRAAGNSLPQTGRANGIAAARDRRDELVDQIEAAIESQLSQAEDIAVTEKQQIIYARRGQGKFREYVQLHEKCCRVSGVGDPRFLIASHIKPWRSGTNHERLDGENGLLLAPNIDFLFDRGFISFYDDGTLLVSPVANEACLAKLGIPIGEPTNVGSFTAKQQEYLAFHRQNVFLEAGRDR